MKLRPGSPSLPAGIRAASGQATHRAARNPVNTAKQPAPGIPRAAPGRHPTTDPSPRQAAPPPPGSTTPARKDPLMAQKHHPATANGPVAGRPQQRQQSMADTRVRAAPILRTSPSTLSAVASPSRASSTSRASIAVTTRSAAPSSVAAAAIVTPRQHHRKGNKS